MISRFNVLGVGVSAISMTDALATIEGWIAARDPNYVCITGVHGIMESQADLQLKVIHNHAGMVTPDGMPLVWLAWLNGLRAVERVYGPDLFLEVAALSLRRGYRHFYYGGGDGVAELLAARMRQRYPGLQIVGTYTPPFRPLTIEEDRQIVNLINAAGADIVWVGLSTPKQERWMAQHVGRVNAPVMVGVGAAFDVHAGLKSQAPRWMQRAGLEWAFRLATEPRRLGRRYLRNNPRFVIRVLAQCTGMQQYPLMAGDGRQAPRPPAPMPK
jgi:N-acetylglucosaminyldiphosphoundecaprenol N-acetyl-beta-D-mannosaminyltransferase